MIERFLAKRKTEGVLSANVLVLAQGVMRSMFYHKMKMIAVGVLTAMALAAVGGWGLQLFAAQAQAPQQTASSEQPPAAQAAAQRDAALAKAAKEQWEGRWQEFKTGKTKTDFVVPWSINWLKAELRLTEKKAERLALHEAHLERLKALEKMAKAQFDAGIIPPTQYHQVVYYRIEAEIWLDELRRGK